jgi:hypothetical protein
MTRDVIPSSCKLLKLRLTADSIPSALTTYLDSAPLSTRSVPVVGTVFTNS